MTGESVWALGPLTLPAAGAVPLEVLATTDAVALFCERAAEATVGFTLTAENATAVKAICARLEGIPLALSWRRPECGPFPSPTSRAPRTSLTSCPRESEVPRIVRPACGARSPGPTTC